MSDGAGRGTAGRAPVDAHVHRAHGRELLLGALVLPHHGQDHRVRHGHLQPGAFRRGPAHLRFRHSRAAHAPVLRRPHRLVGREAVARHRGGGQRRFHGALPGADGVRAPHGGAHRARFRVRDHVGIGRGGRGARHPPRALRRGHRLFLDDAGAGDGGRPVRGHPHHEHPRWLRAHVRVRGRRRGPRVAQPGAPGHPAAPGRGARARRAQAHAP